MFMLEVRIGFHAFTRRAFIVIIQETQLGRMLDGSSNDVLICTFSCLHDHSATASV